MEETFLTLHMNLRYAIIAFVLFQFTHVKMHKHDPSTPYLYIGIYIEVVLVLGLVVLFFALTSIGSTSPKTPKGQTFLRDFPHHEY